MARIYRRYNELRSPRELSSMASDRRHASPPEHSINRQASSSPSRSVLVLSRRERGEIFRRGDISRAKVPKAKEDSRRRRHTRPWWHSSIFRWL